MDRDDILRDLEALMGLGGRNGEPPAKDGSNSQGKARPGLGEGGDLPEADDAPSPGGYTGLRYKTRGNASPQGRPRVYLCCHPADFDRCFEGVCADVLEAQPDAAIWYREPGGPEPSQEELLSDLSRMQLLVVPVTSNLLFGESPARTVELAFALENHIPVLPLMAEGGLAEDFNRIVGDLQFLDREAIDRDPTAIPYAERLSRFLRSVLVGDELAERVRAAFDAYVFLSYRKKDRALAQRVMRSLHADPRLRDVAVWYDEFLVPGEGFNAAIAEAMEKSDAFALAVTPNLLEVPNYVLTEEYPAAVGLGKPVLPVEAAETDRGRLSELYPGVPEPAPLSDPAAVAARLSEALAGRVLPGNDSDPEHLYLVGLAYLTGTDVEADHALALELIEAAAEGGVREAYERLVSMYGTGEGVARDYGRAAGWQERYVEMLGRTTDPLEDTELLDALQELGDMLMGLGRPREAAEAFGRMLGLAEARDAALGTPGTRRDLSLGLERLGGAATAMGDPAGARGYYERSLGVAEHLAEETGTAAAWRDLSAILGKVGDTSMDLGDPAGARGYYERSLGVAERLVVELGTSQAGRDLSAVLSRLGDTAVALGNPEGAGVYYERALDVFERLAEETGTVEDRRGLSAVLGRIGDTAAALGNPEGAGVYYEHALDVFERLAEETGTVEDRRGLSVSLGRVGDTARAVGDPEAAHGYYVRSLEIDERLAEETGTVEDKRGLAVSLGKLGDAAAALGDPAGARGNYGRALGILERLAEETGTVEDRGNLSVSLEKAGDAAAALGDPAGARGNYERALEIRERLAEDTGTPKAYDDLAVSCFKVGIMGSDPAMLLRSLEIYATLSERHPGVARYREHRDILLKVLGG